MVIKRDINFTYNGYLQNLQYANEITDKEYIHQLLLQFKQLSNLSIVLPNAPLFFAIDYSNRQYLFFSNSLGNYPAQEIIEGGLDFTLPLMDKDFYKIYNENVFPTVLSFLRNIPQPEHSYYIVSCNHRIKGIDKKDINFYQRYTYITSKETGLPTQCIGMAVDISHFKNDDQITLSFEKTNIFFLIRRTVFSPNKKRSFYNT